jgi:hypothetical protein
MQVHIFDTQSYLYAGGYYSRRRVSLPIKQSGGEYKAMEMDVSASTYLFNEITRFRRKDVELVFVYDSTPTIKRQLYFELFGDPYGYKAGRSEKPVWLEPNKGLCLEAMQQIGLNVLKKDNYESDDLIASFVRYYKKDFEKVFIHTRDSDLMHLVSDNVTIEPCNRQGKHIDIYNYPTMGKANTTVNYNMAVISRLCFNKKDNVPLIPKEWRTVINTGIPKDVWSKCGDTKLLRYWIQKLTDNDRTVMGIYDLVVPIILSGEEVELTDEVFDDVAFNYYYRMLGCEGSEYYDVVDYPVGEETFYRWIEDYKERGGK